MPVVCCGLHSQLAPVVAGIGPGVRVAYAQLGGGALPVALSDTRAAAEDAAAARDGDRRRAVPRRRRSGGDRRLGARLGEGTGASTSSSAGSGPASSARGSAFGHGGLAVAEAANAAAALGGRAIVAVRYSAADPRERHRGVSHHTRSALRLMLGAREVAWPAGLERDAALGDVVEVDVEGWQEACSSLPLAHMGRGPADDPWFFASAFAAGRHARALLG